MVLLRARLRLALLLGSQFLELPQFLKVLKLSQFRKVLKHIPRKLASKQRWKVNLLKALT